MHPNNYEPNCNLTQQSIMDHEQMRMDRKKGQESPYCGVLLRAPALIQCAKSDSVLLLYHFPHQRYSSILAFAKIAQTWLGTSSVSSKAVICTLKPQQLDISALAPSPLRWSLQLELCQPCVRIIKPTGAVGLSGAHLSQLKFPQGSSQCLMHPWFSKQPIISSCLCQWQRHKRQHRGELGARGKGCISRTFCSSGKHKNRYEDVFIGNNVT